LDIFLFGISNDTNEIMSSSSYHEHPHHNPDHFVVATNASLPHAQSAEDDDDDVDAEEEEDISDGEDDSNHLHDDHQHTDSKNIVKKFPRMHVLLTPQYEPVRRLSIHRWQGSWSVYTYAALK
jgi:hypothetical protein